MRGKQILQSGSLKGADPHEYESHRAQGRQVIRDSVSSFLAHKQGDHPGEYVQGRCERSSPVSAQRRHAACRHAPARVGMGRCRAVQSCLQVERQGVISGLIGPGHADRRHGTAAQLLDHLLPHLGLLVDVLDICLVEQKLCRTGRLVVTGHAVLV